MQADVELKIVQEQIPRLFRRYAIPGIVAMLFMAIQTIADGLIVGRLISANALAAVNIISPIYTLVTLLPFWFGLDGIWISTPVAELITVIVALFLLKNRMKLNGIK